MEAKELRIGNLVQPISVIKLADYDNSNIIAVNGLCILDFERLKDKWNYKPIPLTDKWLLKFGFKIRRMDYIYKVNDITSILIAGYARHFNGQIISEERQVSLIQVKDTVYLPKIKYVHQIQNLYFALTGEELITTP